jgi:hypothetical protein
MVIGAWQFASPPVDSVPLQLRQAAPGNPVFIDIARQRVTELTHEEFEIASVPRVAIFARMPPAKSSKSWYVGVIRAISTPLGFYVLSLLIVDTTIVTVLTFSRLNERLVWWGFFVVILLFLVVFGVVTFLVIKYPKNLLYGKEEHSNPALEPSALRDAIEDTIAAKVKPECLQNPRT